MLACAQSLVRSLPSLGGLLQEGEAGTTGTLEALRQISTPEASQYPGFEPPLVQAQKRLRQRRRAEDAVADTQVMNMSQCLLRTVH